MDAGPELRDAPIGGTDRSAILGRGGQKGLFKTLVFCRDETALPDRNTLEVFYLPIETRVNAVIFLRESHGLTVSTLRWP
jgi:hypothetical protein